MGSSTIRHMMTLEPCPRKPFGIVIAAPKWSRLNHALTAFGPEHPFVGWPCFLSRPGTSSPPALSGLGLIEPTDTSLLFLRTDERLEQGVELSEQPPHDSR